MALLRQANYNLVIEIIVRLLLIGMFCYLEGQQPHIRETHKQDLETIYKYHRKDSYVPSNLLWGIVLSVPFLLSMISMLALNDYNDGIEILLVWSLALGLTGVITDLFKVMVGRLRPDFFYRCFPDSVMTDDLQCTGDPNVIKEGRKSFPSGHSSLSFFSLGTLSLWMCGRLGVFSRRRVSAPALPLVGCLAPLLAAAAVAVSRLNDYHHHMEDIVTGSAIGLTVAAVCYRQYYNPLSSENSGVSYIVTNVGTVKFVNGKSDSPLSEKLAENAPLLARKDDKWI